MDVKILAFGIARDIFGGAEISVSIDMDASVEALKRSLEKRYPKLRMLSSYMVALNEEYSESSDIIKQDDEIAIIPPVSGG